MSVSMVDAAPAVVLVHPPDCRSCEIIIDGTARSMLAVREIAGRWGLSARVVYRLIHEGRLPVLDLRPPTTAGAVRDDRATGGNGDRYRISACAVRELETGYRQDSSQ